jgi:putative nucleotidyltransferase with HDIG domain
MFLRTRVRAGWLAGVLLSLTTAVLLTLVYYGDAAFSAFEPKFGSPSPVTLRVPHRFVPRADSSAVARGDSPANFRMQHLLVPVGTELSASETTHKIAVSHELTRRKPTALHILGSFILFSTLCMSLVAYLRKFGQNRLRLFRSQVGLFGLVLSVFVFCKLQLMFSGVSEFWLPVGLVPLWVSTSFDRRTALVVALVMAFITASLLRFDVVFLVGLLSQGMASVLVFVDRKHSRAMLSSGFFAGVSAAIMLIAMALGLDGRFEWAMDLSHGLGSRLLGCLGGGLLTGGLGALLVSPASRILGHVPRERLHDLTDLEQPLLKHMAQHAPGSWEHSRAMANLAEQAASAIGADALLVRVGAYYHDLGKSVRPKFFVENLAPGEPTPHNELSPEASADVIRAHVVEGTKILREGGIPEPVVEFAYTHHGTQVVEYFWNKCKERCNPNGLTKDDFRYPGMKPQTKETAILMLVDSIEAASRTIDEPDRAQFENMIQRIVFSKLASGQLDDCPLNMKELNTIVSRMAETLVNMHHHRIKYPWQIKQAAQFGIPAQVMSAPPPPKSVVPAPAAPTTERESTEFDSDERSDVTTRH